MLESLLTTPIRSNPAGWVWEGLIIHWYLLVYPRHVMKLRAWHSGEGLGGELHLALCPLCLLALWHFMA